jgi:starch phosphorylase
VWTLLYRTGYFHQTLDDEGGQSEQLEAWQPADVVALLPTRTSVSVGGARVQVQAWRYDVRGHGGFSVPLLLLDTDLPENAPEHRALTSSLYAGDDRYRLAQEIVLGVGGLRMLRALGYSGLTRYHMNEGHSSRLALELLRERAAQEETKGWDFASVRGHCVFTTHTPVPAGHDQFSYDTTREMLGDEFPLELVQMLGGEDRLNMTLLAMNLSQYVNGVAKKHGEVSRSMFLGYPIDAVTNGVHSATWTCESFQRLFDRHIPGWAADPFLLRNAIRIPTEEIWTAHVEAKRRLVERVNQVARARLDPDALTLGFARRATQYKRMALVLRDPDALRSLVHRVGSLQLVFAGKAHPHDDPGKHLIREVFAHARELRGVVEIAYLPDYDTELARLLTAGADVWLNTPSPPLEASGTSGMKAAHNGVPSLSILDGWWLEGHLEGTTGWSIGSRDRRGENDEERDRADAGDLYRKLGEEIARLFYGDREGWVGVMRHAVAINASFFNTHRMVQQYAAHAYLAGLV